MEEEEDSPNVFCKEHQMAQGTGTGTQAQYKCAHCGKTFNSSAELHEHEKNCKSGSEKR